MWKGFLAAALLATSFLAGCNAGDRNAMNDDTPAKEIRRGVDDVIDDNYTPRYNNEINSAPNSTVPPALRDERNGAEVDRVAPNDGVDNDGRVIERRVNEEDIIEDPADMRDRNNVDNR
ncbi:MULTISPECIES: hypothetical protein [Bacillales]|uniref:Lipoprotein n=1 Tax=Lysinibacillus louembei TaxID=1470088 RepID=A0ABZ0RZ19_9BACI|nr:MULTISPECIES: hypothetical protein [Bacillales]MCT6923406.1 hypothetical protein [Metasolibacillus sp.]MCT6939872.1 hypothetical protein [Metasolibacillus sp.]WPK12496.1 hypothetical protein R6U77_02025 [Lysinibacillus louembei]